jgi:hypothetical protein
MEYDKAKIEEALLALLGVFEFENGRVWKRYDFATMDALHAKGLFAEPRGRQKSLCLTDNGMRLAKDLAAKHFGTEGAAPQRQWLRQQADEARCRRSAIRAAPSGTSAAQSGETPARRRAPIQASTSFRIAGSIGRGSIRLNGKASSR